MVVETLLQFLPETYLVLGVVILLAYGAIDKSFTKAGYLLNITKLNMLLMMGGLLITMTTGEVVKSIIIVASIVVIVVTKAVYVDKRARLEDYELNILISLTVIGLMLMISARDLVLMYLAIEIMSLSQYILATIRKTGQYSTEAGLKYIVLGALSSGIILLGIGLIYVLTGTVDWVGLAHVAEMWPTAGVAIGGILILVALLFKLGVAPFHMWVPDVYEGAPTIVTLFFAVVPKIAIVTLIINLITSPLLGAYTESIQPIIMGTGIVSIIIGSLAAVNQTKIKRVLAYSAVAHMGWVLIGLGVGTQWGLEASIIYMIIYMIMAVNSFSVVINEYSPSGNNYIIELSGLSRRSPVIAFAFAMSLLSIAGIPPLAGFYSKYNLIIALVEEGWIMAGIIGIVVSVIGAYYYIRIIQLMYFGDTRAYTVKELAEVTHTSVIQGRSEITAGVIGLTLYIILTYLIYPNPLITLASTVVL